MPLVRQIATILMFNRLYCKKCKYYPYYDGINKIICKGCGQQFVVMKFNVPGLSIGTIRVWTNESN